MSTTQTSWLSNLLAKIGSWFSTATTETHDFAVIADNLANTVKTVEASTVGQVFETTLEMIIPASTGLVNAFKLYWPKLITTLNLAVAETGKSDTQIVVDGAGALNKMKGIDPNAYATTVTGIAANIKQWLMDNTGSGGTIQQGIITQVIAHDPSLATIIGKPVVATSTSAPVNAVDDAPYKINNIPAPVDNNPPLEAPVVNPVSTAYVATQDGMNQPG